MLFRKIENVVGYDSWTVRVSNSFFKLLEKKLFLFWQ